jgi:hypothetical protein
MVHCQSGEHVPHDLSIMDPVPYKSWRISSLFALSVVSSFFEALVLGCCSLVLRSSMRNVSNFKIMLHKMGQQ